MDGLDVIIGDGSSRLAHSPRTSQPRRAKPKRRLGRFLPFLLLVVLPTVLAGVYLWGFAAEQYVSESRFIVRGPAQQTPGVLTSFLQTAGVSRAQDDTYAVQDYILSRDALNELEQDANIRELFARPEADFWARFPNFMTRDSFEHLFKYYLKHVDVEMDSTTGVSELTVRMFRPEDAQRVATALLAAGERLVNRMNERERDNAVQDARKEVALAEQRVQEVANKIADFRNKESLLDPDKQSVPMLAAITALQAKLSATRLEVSQLQASSPNSPLLASTRQRASALQAQIDDQRGRVAGSDGSMVGKIRAFDMLSLEREFADKQLASATTSLETSRMNSYRQQFYLETIVRPNSPDYAEFPHRISSLAIVFVSLCGLYVMGALLISGAREHKLV